MDFKISLEHEYVIGGLDQIKRGDFGEDFSKTFDLEEAVMVFPTYDKKSAKSSALIIPSIIGVYRRTAIIFGDETEELIEKRLDLGAKPEFDVHPSLVQVGYDPNLFSRDIITDFLGDDAERIITVPYNRLRQSGKCIEELTNLTERLVQSRFNNKTFSQSDIAEAVNLASRMIHTEGICREEYDLLICHKMGRIF